MKLATTRGRVGGRSGVDVGLFSPFCVGFEFIDDIEREGVGALKTLKAFFYKVSRLWSD